MSRGKSVPAFDSFFDMSSTKAGVNTSQTAEVVEFGDSATNARHFMNFSSQYVGGAAISSDLPWYIRDGSIATDTSAMVIGDLATSLENLLGTSAVNAAEDWDKGHAVNADPAGFSAWVTQIVAAK